MTKQEILDKFSDIDFVYNDSSKHETLSKMLDELLKEQQKEYYHLRNMLCDAQNELNSQPQIVRCKDCKKRNQHKECEYGYHSDGWFCADGERIDDN